MEQLEGKVAVVTGAASGMGRAFAERFVQEGMKVVLADVEVGALETAVAELQEAGGDVVGVRTDVSRLEEVEALAARTIDAFGAVHVVCNNAGVESGATFADIPAETWDWVLGVDLLGTIYGIKTFLPLLREHAPDGHIVNTSSIAGLDSYFLTAAPYVAAKHAVVGISEDALPRARGRQRADRRLGPVPRDDRHADAVVGAQPARPRPVVARPPVPRAAHRAHDDGREERHAARRRRRARRAGDPRAPLLRTHPSGGGGAGRQGQTALDHRERPAGGPDLHMTATHPEIGVTPETLIDRAIALRPKLIEEQAATEERTYYSQEMHEEFQRAGFYRLYIPRRYGGYEFDVPAMMRLMLETGARLPVDRVVHGPRVRARAAARLVVARAGAGARSSATATSVPRPSRRRSGSPSRRTTAGR